MTQGIGKKLLMALVVVVVVSSSCGKYEDGPNFSLIAKKSRITGDWELVRIVPGGTPQGVTIIFEIEKDGDFKMVQDYGSYSYAYAGTWEFEDQKETLEIIMDGTVTELKITRLTNKEMNLEYTYTYSGGQTQTATWEFEKQ